MPNWFHHQRPDGRWEHTLLPEPTPASNGKDSPTYVCGLDLGKQVDYTALSILERHAADGGSKATYLTRFLKRWPLGTRYQTIVAEVAAILARAPLTRDANLVIDYGGVGIAVAEQFTSAHLPARLSLVTITGGETIHQEMIEGVPRFSVPKRELVGVVTVLLQQDRLKIAPSLPEAQTLVAELQAFEVKISESGHDSYNARSGAHDDAVLSVALAAWFGERPQRQAYVY